MDARRVVTLLLVVCCCGVWVGVAARTAAAEPVEYEPPSEAVSEPPLAESLGDCPPAELEAFGGEDQAAAETRALRADLGRSCAALSDRLDELAHRVYWLAAEAVEAHAQRVVTNEKLTALVELAEAPVTVGGQPLEVSDSGTANVAASVDASGEALKGAIWFGVGVLVAAFACYVIYRQVMPRA